MRSQHRFWRLDGFDRLVFGIEGSLPQTEVSSHTTIEQRRNFRPTCPHVGCLRFSFSLIDKCLDRDVTSIYIDTIRNEAQSCRHLRCPVKQAHGLFRTKSPSQYATTPAEKPALHSALP